MRLFQFWYSPFAAKIRKYLDLKGLDCEIVEVPYLDRRELVAVTGGYALVPVLEDGDQVVTDSARISAYLDERYAPSLRDEPATVMIEQWAEGPLEEIAFRVAAPGIESRFPQAQGGREDARSLFRLMRERRFGRGCIEAWRRDAESLSEQLSTLLSPVAKAVSRRRFILGDEPSLADAAVFGQLTMVELSAPGWLAARTPGLRDWWQRMK